MSNNVSEVFGTSNSRLRFPSSNRLPLRSVGFLYGLEDFSVSRNLDAQSVKAPPIPFNNGSEDESLYIFITVLNTFLERSTVLPSTGDITLWYIIFALASSFCDPGIKYRLFAFLYPLSISFWDISLSTFSCNISG